MKVFAVVLLFAAVVCANDMMVSSSYGGSAPAPSYGGSAPAPAPSYGGGSAPATIPAPPCPTTYLFSCQPSMQPTPCASPAPAPSSSYGSAGAYSANYPRYALPQYGGVNNFQAY